MFPRFAGGFLAHDSIDSPDDGVGARFTCMAAVGRNRLIAPVRRGVSFWGSEMKAIRQAWIDFCLHRFAVARTDAARERWLDRMHRAIKRQMRAY